VYILFQSRLGDYPVVPPSQIDHRFPICPGREDSNGVERR
jgi:hypothetical protein